MNQLTKSKIENGTLVLPQVIRKFWQNKEVVILPEKDRLIIQPFENEWNEYEKKLIKTRKKISSNIIDEAVKWAKKQS